MPPNGPVMSYATVVRNRKANFHQKRTEINVGKSSTVRNNYMRTLSEEQKNVHNDKSSTRESFPNWAAKEIEIYSHPLTKLPNDTDPEAVSTWNEFQIQCNKAGVLYEGLIMEALLALPDEDIFNEWQSFCADKAYWQFPRSIVGNADVTGDALTAVTAIKSYGEKKNTTEQEKWCRNLRMNKQSLDTFDSFCDQRAHELGYTLKDESKREPTLKTRDNALLDILGRTLKDHLCVFMGHKSLGYYKIATNEIVEICPLSATHLLTKMPQYALCYPKTGLSHNHCHCGACHHIIAIEDDKAQELLADTGLHPPDDSVIVSPVADLDGLGRRGMHEFEDAWHGANGHEWIQGQLHSKCNASFIIWDQRETELTTRLSIYAAPVYHDAVREVINGHTTQIREKLLNDRAVFKFPNNKSDFHMVLSPGMECHDVLFPGQTFAKDLENITIDGIVKDKEMLDILSDVHLRIRVGDLRSLDKDMKPTQHGPHKSTSTVLTHITNGERREPYNPELKARAILKRLFSDLQEKWSIQEYTHIHDSSELEIHILVTDYFTAKRAMMLVEEGASIGIPLKILNKFEVEKKLQQFEIRLHHSIFGVLHESLRQRLEHFRRSQRFGIEYEIVENCHECMRVLVKTKCLQHAVELKQVFSDCLGGLLCHYTERDYGVLNSTVFKVILKEFMSKTSTVIVPYHFRRKLVIYGASSQNREEAKALLFAELARRNDWSNTTDWHTIEPFTTPQLPVDILYKVNRELFARKSHLELKTARIDYYTKEMHLLCQLSGGNSYSVANDKFQTLVNRVLIEQFGHSSEDPVYLGELQSSLKPECCVCLSPVPLQCSPYVLEGCGHTYCSECLKSQVQTAVSTGSLPLTCGSCMAPFSVHDLRYVCSYPRVVHIKRILKMALSAFVRINNKSYRFCPRGNCEGIYRVNRSDKIIYCSLCPGMVCPSCLNPYHRGLTCEEYEQSFLSIKNWLNESGTDRKQCPNCQMAIEKVDGCNNVHCLFCMKSICWTCLMAFESSDDCYGHMDEDGHW